METEAVVQIIQEFLYTSLLLAGPAVATSLVIGVVISIFQTITSIQEQTLSLAPKILGVAVVSGLTIAWFLDIAMTYTRQLFEKITEIGLST